MSEQYRRLALRKARLDALAIVLSDILRGMTEAQSRIAQHASIKGPHAFNSEATLLLKAETRGQAVAMLQYFPPEGLDCYQLREGGRAFVVNGVYLAGPAWTNREPIVPFLYHTVQNRRLSLARHTLTWVCKLKNGVQVTVECDIRNDLAGFTLEHVDDVAHNQVLFRRVPNSFMPDGPYHDCRGMSWYPTKDVSASVTIWWPYEHPKLLGLRERPTDIAELAAILLEVTQEAHAHE